MCMRGNFEVESCKTLIQCFKDTLQRWWELEFSNMVWIRSFPCTNCKNGRISCQRWSLGSLTSFILEHWCGATIEIANKHAWYEP